MKRGGRWQRRYPVTRKGPPPYSSATSLQDIVPHQTRASALADGSTPFHAPPSWQGEADGDLNKTDEGTIYVLGPGPVVTIACFCYVIIAGPIAMPASEPQSVPKCCSLLPRIRIGVEKLCSKWLLEDAVSLLQFSASLCSVHL